MNSSSAAKTRSCSMRLFSSGCGLVITGLTLALGCASNGGTRVGSAIVPAISNEPNSQSVRVGGSVAFTVVASGTAPLSYQWSKNGTAITGVTGASYATPAATATDNGAVFSVKVSNAAGSVSSTPAVLTVLPRAPTAGDWRFQGVDLPYISAALTTNLYPPWNWNYPNSFGSPLQVGATAGTCVPGVAYDCTWFYLVWNTSPSSTRITTYYAQDAFSNLDTDLNGLTAPNVVITSLDLEPDNQIFAYSWLQTSAPSGFVLQQQWVEPPQFQAVASQLGTESRVITAVSFNAGQLCVLSYSWQSDTTTIYDVQVVTTTADTFWTQAQGLSQSGYIITAMGGDPADGVVLVGTKVKGDTMVRPFQYSTTSGTQGQVRSDTHSLLRLIYMPNEGDSFNQQ